MEVSCLPMTEALQLSAVIYVEKLELSDCPNTSWDPFLTLHFHSHILMYKLLLQEKKNTQQVLEVFLNCHNLVWLLFNKNKNEGNRLSSVVPLPLPKVNKALKEERNVK